MIRLNKYIAKSTSYSRREADAIIADGKVRVNDELVTEMGTKVDEDDRGLVVVVKGKEIKSSNKTLTYIALHKPRGYTVTKDDPHAERIIMQLLPESLQHVHPVGRLDKDSEGLLLLTNDGEFTNQLTHPKFEKEKEYSIQTKKPLTTVQLKRLQSGIQLEEGNTGKVDATLNPDGSLTMILQQGWNQQIRRMIKEVGGSVRTLRRERVGKLQLGQLPRGKWNIIKPTDVV